MSDRLILSKKSQGQIFEPAGELHLAFPVQGVYSQL